MTIHKELAPVVVLGEPGGSRDALARAVGRWGPVRPLAPAELADPGSFEDAAACVTLLAREGALSLARDLARVDALPDSIAVVEDVEPEELEAALEQLGPCAVLTAPVAGPVLRYTLERVAPSGSGRGARVQHRPARLLLGVSAAIRKVTEQINQFADSRLPVLILGETGTGKELVARALHARSRRAEGPFVAVNCGGLAESLLEAELFGHVRGAFTGATRDRQGLFADADGGTLFLDEIAETSPALQVKLLRVLETGEVRPVGGNGDRVCDVRVVSATHRSLEDHIEEGTFRQDLFYRLNAATIHLPPLRRRRVDIPFLAQHFAEEFGAARARGITLGEDFLDALAQRDFPGNVRELRNAIERAIALASPGQTLGSEELALDDSGRPPLLAMGTLADRVAQVEIQAIQEALQRFDGNKTRVAEALGISRVGLRQKMKRLGLA